SGHAQDRPSRPRTFVQEPRRGVDRFEFCVFQQILSDVHAEVSRFGGRMFRATSACCARRNLHVFFVQSSRQCHRKRDVHQLFFAFGGLRSPSSGLSRARRQDAVRRPGFALQALFAFFAFSTFSPFFSFFAFFALFAFWTLRPLRALSARAPIDAVLASRAFLAGEPCLSRQRLQHTRADLLGRGDQVALGGERSACHREHQRKRQRHVRVGDASAYHREHLCSSHNILVTPAGYLPLFPLRDVRSPE